MLLSKIADPVALSEIKSSTNSLVTSIGGRKATEAIRIGSIALRESTVEFSFINSLREPVKRIQGILIFRDKEGDPMHFTIIKHDDEIPAGLAKRTTEVLDSSVARYHADLKIEERVKAIRDGLGKDRSELQPRIDLLGLLEFRILSFEIAGSN
jgi:hypothetical protein